jgi:hypothetical protein
MSRPPQRVVFAGRDLLDRQIVDVHDEPIGKVDDIELDATGSHVVARALLSGQIAWGGRLGGRFGLWVASLARRLRGPDGHEPRRFDLALVRRVGHTVVLTVPAAELPPADLEQWLDQHFVGRIPGA